MAASYKILGQADLAATTLTDVYTVPASTETIISTMILANRTGTATSFRIAIREDGDAVADKHYIAYGVPLAANDSTTLTLGITLEATDVVSVYSAAEDVSVNIFGAEIPA